MPRSLPAAAATIALLAACSSPPPPLPPLALGERFDVTYEGRVAPLQPMPPAEAEAKGPLAHLSQSVDAQAEAGADTAAIRMWLVELRANDADALALAEGQGLQAGRPPQARGARVEPAALVDRVMAWTDRARVVSAPFLTTKLDTQASLRMSQQRAAVSQLRLVSQGGGLAVDPQVENYELGTQIDVRVRRDGEHAIATITWAMVDGNQPRTVARIDGGAFGSLEVPIALQQKSSADVKVAAHGAFLLGPVATTDRRFVQVLAVEIDAR